MSERILKYNDVVVTLKLDMSIGIGGDKWPAAELFCNIATNEKFIPSFESLFNGKRIMELGSGTGLCGIVIDKLYKPKEVYVSDLQVKDTLPTISLCLHLYFDVLRKATIPVYGVYIESRASHGAQYST